MTTTRYARSVIRLAVVDDHPAIVAAVVESAAGRGEFDVVGRATTVDAAISVIETAAPDVVLCDLWIGGEPGGLEIVKRFGRLGRPRILVLSGFEQPSFLRASFESGAAGYLSKALEVDEILEAVVAVAAGETRFPAVTLSALRDTPRAPSTRELEAIRLLARGATNDEIAMGLGISIKTVESHLRRLYGRYGLLSRTELALLAVREGWLGSGA
jgi:DNA-binding NarL/FixJ family response regulator